MCIRYNAFLPPEASEIMAQNTGNNISISGESRWKNRSIWCLIHVISSAASVSGKNPHVLLKFVWVKRHQDRMDFSWQCLTSNSTLATFVDASEKLTK